MQASRIEDIPGQSQSVQGKVLEAAEGAIQRFSPFSRIHQHVCGFHFYAYDITHQVSSSVLQCRNNHCQTLQETMSTLQQPHRLSHTLLRRNWLCQCSIPASQMLCALTYSMFSCSFSAATHLASLREHTCLHASLAMSMCSVKTPVSRQCQQCKHSICRVIRCTCILQRCTSAQAVYIMQLCKAIPAAEHCVAATSCCDRPAS